VGDVMREKALMSEDEALLEEIFARPWDDGPRLSYAGVLTGRGDPRGELIRVQIEIFVDEAGHRLGPRYGENLKRRDELLAAHGREWAAPLSPLVDRWSFQRGFPDLVKLGARAFLERAQAIFDAAPVLHLDVTGLDAGCGDFFASPHLRRLRSLLLYESRIGDQGVERLAASPHLVGLRYLDLMLNQVTRRGLEALCASPNLPSLRYVKLTSNPVDDPHDRPVSVDNGRILDWEALPIQAELEARHGRKPWLHYRTTYERFYPPEPEWLMRP
jgi:uncharacterized protein (TIGR02996 family)